MKTFQISLTLSVLAASMIGAAAAQVVLPETPKGTIVRAYLEAFNSGNDDSVRQFFLRHLSPEALSERPVEARLARLKMFRSEAKRLTLTRLVEEGPASMTLVAATGGGEALMLTFEFDSARAYTFAGLRVERGDERPPRAVPPMTRKEFLLRVDSALSKAARDDEFSGAVLVARDSSVLFEQAYGYAEKRGGVRNRTDTKFNLGSINKMFTRIAIGQLAQSGKLSLDQPVMAYLPDCPNRAIAGKVTIRHLLEMESGMGDFFGPRFEETPMGRLRSLADYLPLFIQDSLLFEPGTRKRYSNAGYILLGLIIEKVSGEDYYGYIRDHLFAPAGMRHSDWYTSDAVVANLATGYTHPPGDTHTWISNIHTLPGRGSSAGGGYSTLGDLQAFLRALASGKLLSPKYTEWALTGELPSDDPPLPLRRGSIGLAGGTAGVNAAVEFDAEKRGVVIVLSNYDPPSAERQARAIRSWLKSVR